MNLKCCRFGFGSFISACGSFPGIYRAFSQFGGCRWTQRSSIDLDFIQVHLQVMGFRIVNCPGFECNFLECPGSFFIQGKGSMPLFIMEAWNSDTYDGITVKHMFGLISCCLDPDLKLSRFFGNFLGSCQVNTCKINQNIIFPYSPDRNIFQTQRVELVIKDVSCQVSGLSADSFFVS